MTNGSEAADRIPELLTRIDELTHRVATLEREVAPVLASARMSTVAPALPQQPPPSVASPVTAGSPPPPTTTSPRCSPPGIAAPPVADAPLDVSPAALDTEAALKWTGVFLVVLAAAFAVSTAIQRGWIGPELQLAGAVLVGLGLIGSAIRMQTTRPPWALALAHGGLAVLATSAIAGHTGLDLYPVPVALGAALVVTAGGAWLAGHFNRASLAVFATAIAAIAPAASRATTEYEFWIWPLALAALTAVAMGLGIVRQWHALRLATIAITAGPLLVVAAAATSDRHDLAVPATWVGAVIVLALWWVASTTWAAGDQPAAAADDNNSWAQVDAMLQSLGHRLTVALPLVAWVVTGQLFTNETENGRWWWALTIAAISAVVAVGSQFLNLVSDTTFRAHLVGAGILSAIAFAGLFDGPVQLIAIAAHAVGLGWFAYRETDLLATVSAGVLAVITVGWTAVGIGAACFDGAPIAEDLTHALIIAIAGAIAWIGREHAWSRIVAVGVWIATMAWFISVFSQLDQGQLVVSVIWAAMGAAALLFGLHRRVVDAAHLGLATIAATVLKLLTVDLASVDTMWRAGLFFVVGLGLLRLALTVAALKDEEAEQPAKAGQTRLTESRLSPPPAPDPHAAV